MSTFAWLLGLVLTGYLIRRVGAASIGHALERVGARFVWLVAAYAAATAVAAIPWALLLPARARPSWHAVVTSRFAASGLAALLPFFGLGEAGRLLWMPRVAWSSGTAAIVVDRLIYLVAGALFLFAAAGSARSLGSLPPQLISGAVVVALAILALSGGIALIAARGQLGRAWNRLLATFAPGRSRAPGAWEPSLRAMLVGPRRTLLAGLTIHLASRLLFALEIYAGLAVARPAVWLARDRDLRRGADRALGRRHVHPRPARLAGGRAGAGGGRARVRTGGRADARAAPARAAIAVRAAVGCAHRGGDARQSRLPREGLGTLRGFPF